MGSFFSESSAFPSATSCCPVVWGSERVRGEGEISKPGITFPGEILFHFEFSEPQPGFSPQQRQEGPDAPTHEHLPTSTFPTSLRSFSPLPGGLPKVISRDILAPGCWFFPSKPKPPPCQRRARNCCLRSLLAASIFRRGSTELLQSSSTGENQLQHKPSD